MSYGILVVYCLINVVLGLALHASRRHFTLTAPKRGELFMYALLFLVAGLPMLVGAVLYASLRSIQHQHRASIHRPFSHS